MADIRVVNHGSIVLIAPVSEEGSGWLKDHLPEDAQRWAGAYAVEPRYVEAIINGAREEGLTVE